jgi:hypothetical protein
MKRAGITGTGIMIALTAAACFLTPLATQARVDTAFSTKRAAVKAAVEIVGINVGIWAIDRYIIADDDVYNISINTMRSNMQHGFVWDNDQFSTNLLGHPYHGGLYFNAARSSGLGFVRSVPYSFAGSLMWEYLMEAEPPSINDFISTSVGGVVLGEITFRLSDLLIDSRTVGMNRFGRELLAAMISPVRGLNRIISGEAWKVRGRKNELGDSIPLSFAVAAGHRALAEDSEIRTELDNGLYIDVRLNYGNLFSEDCKRPYDAFILRASLNFFSQQPLFGNINITGQIWGKNIPLKSEKSSLHWGIFQHFDYYDSNTVTGGQRVNSYRIAETAAAGVGVQAVVPMKRNKAFISSVYLSGILLGGSITDYYRVTDRDYNLGSGFSSKLNAGIFGRKAGLGIKVEDYRLFTWKGYDPDVDLSLLTLEEQRQLNVQGDKGNVGFTIYSINLYYRFKKRIMISLETSYYFRNSYYKYFPNVKYQIVENRAGIGIFF